MNSINSESKQADPEFEKLNQQKQASLVQEFFHFILQNKAWWMVPIVVVLGLMSVLAFLSTTGVAPFIYPLF